MLAVDIVAPQLSHRQLVETRELVDGGVLLVPADVTATVAWARLVHCATPIRAEELAGAEAGFDALAALAVALDDVALFGFAHREPQEPGESPDVVSADFDVPSGPAAERRAFQAIERLASHAASLTQAGWRARAVKG